MSITINPSEDFRRPKLLLGDFFAHVIKVEKGSPINVNGVKSTPYNITCVLAPENADITGKDPETGEEVKADILVGLTPKSRGLWYSENPTEKWRIKRYFNFYQVVFNPKPNDDGTIELNELNEIDALGKPVIVSLGFEYDKRDAGLPKEEQRKYIKIYDFKKWEGGYEIDPSTIEEYPF